MPPEERNDAKRSCPTAMDHLGRCCHHNPSVSLTERDNKAGQDTERWGRRSFTTTCVLSLLIGLVLLAFPRPGIAQSSECPPLSPPTGTVVTVSSEAELRDRAYNAAAGTTIMIAAGVYNMQDFIYVVHDGIALRSATGNRGDVTLDFGGMVSGHFGILVDADDVTIADLTIRNAADHGVSIQGRDRPVLYNLHIQDIGDQLVKVNPHIDGINGSEDGLLACSRLEYTTSAPDSYTNGISAHRARRWVVRDNWRLVGPFQKRLLAAL